MARRRKYGATLRSRCPRCRRSVILNWRKKQSKSPQSLVISGPTAEIAGQLEFLCPYCQYYVDLGRRPELW